jgi:hypothetical protein
MNHRRRLTVSRYLRKVPHMDVLMPRRQDAESGRDLETVSSSIRLAMRFQEPQALVQIARDSREQIAGIRIAQLP